MSDQAQTSQADGQDSDEALLRRIGQKDHEALTRLFERYSRLVYSVALRVLKDKERAEDVLQDIFMQIWSRPLSLNQARGNLSSLLAVTARNRSIDTLRRQKHTQSPDDLQLASNFDLSGASEHRLLLDRVRKVALELPAEQQTVLNLAFFEGLTHTEIAAATGTPLGTVKTRIRAALNLLERTLHA